MTERTLVLLHQSFRGVWEQMTGDIARMLNGRGELISLKDIERAPADLVDAHYAHVVEPYKGWVMEAMPDKPLRLIVYEGNGIVEAMLDITGRKTDPSLCAAGTIRNMYAGGWETIARSRAEKRRVENGVHRSDSGISANNELRIWGPVFGVDYTFQEN